MNNTLLKNILLTFILVGACSCDQIPTPKTSNSSEAKQADPVAELQHIANSISNAKLSIPESEIIMWKLLESPGSMLDPEIEYWFRPIGIDVQKTDSLVSPLIGFITLHRNETYKQRFGSFKCRLAFARQNDEWIVKSFEYEAKDGSWKKFNIKSPLVKMTRQILPNVTWQLD